MVTAGAFARVLARPRLAALGTAVAGFGLIFVGIDFMEQGMAGLGGRVPIAQLPEHGVLSHLLALALGLLGTIVVQSSSAAAAMALTALATDTINFDHAASFLIGTAIGTTVTGALASISGKAPARRTAVAHILFNASAGLIALVTLPWLLDWVAFAQQRFGLPPGPLSLAFFHSTFILLGILIFMPLLPRYVGWLERLIPDQGSALTRHLDPALYAVPVVALEASQRALRGCAAELAKIFEATLRDPRQLDTDPRRQEVADAIDALRRFLADLPAVDSTEAIASRLAQMHGLEHLLRLQSRLFVQPDILQHLGDIELADARVIAQRAAGLAAQGLALVDPPADWLPRLEADADALAMLRMQSRPQLLQLATEGRHSPGDVLQALDAMRWLERVAHHLWRIAVHVQGEPEPLEPHQEDPLPV
jgi:phosphate:Na+ symporter